MTDTIVKGSGNSRSLKTVPNAKTLYPTYDAFLTGLIEGTIPIDLGGLNSPGLSQKGTDLNKANILPNATCTNLGIATSSVPKDAFNRLRTLVQTAQDAADDAQNAADAAPKLAFGSYAGTATFGESSPNTLTFSSPPKALFIIGENVTPLVAFKPGPETGHMVYGTATSSICKVSWSGNSVSWYYPYSGNQAAAFQHNARDRTYYYMAIL